MIIDNYNKYKEPEVDNGYENTGEDNYKTIEISSIFRTFKSVSNSENFHYKWNLIFVKRLTEMRFYKLRRNNYESLKKFLFGV